jgi:hypothetical protein
VRRGSISCRLAAVPGHAGSRGRRLGKLAACVCLFGAEGRPVARVSSPLRPAPADRDNRISRMQELQTREPDELEQRVDPECPFNCNTPACSPRSQTKAEDEGCFEAAGCPAVSGSYRCPRRRVPPDRLHVLSARRALTGTVVRLSHEQDGDRRIALDTGGALTKAINASDEAGTWLSSSGRGTVATCPPQPSGSTPDRCVGSRRQSWLERASSGVVGDSGGSPATAAAVWGSLQMSAPVKPPRTAPATATVP